MLAEEDDVVAAAPRGSDVVTDATIFADDACIWRTGIFAAQHLTAAGSAVFSRPMVTASAPFALAHIAFAAPGRARLDAGSSTAITTITTTTGTTCRVRSVVFA